MICCFEGLGLEEPAFEPKIPLQVVARVKKASNRVKRPSETKSDDDGVSANGSENKLSFLFLGLRKG